MQHSPFPAIITEGHVVGSDVIVSRRSNKIMFKNILLDLLSKMEDDVDDVSLDGVVSALRDDPGELCERASVQFDPGGLVVGVSAPRSSVHIVLVS